MSRRSRTSRAIDPYANVQGGSRGTALRVAQLEETKAIAQQDADIKRSADELQKAYDQTKSYKTTTWSLWTTIHAKRSRARL